MELPALVLVTLRQNECLWFTEKSLTMALEFPGNHPELQMTQKRLENTVEKSFYIKTRQTGDQTHPTP